MAKKIYDIFPPHIKTDDRLNIKQKKEKPSRNLNIRKIGIIFGSSLLLLFLGYTFFLRVDIIISPKTEEVSFSGRIEIKTDALQVDYLSRIIPGKLIEVEKEKSKTFSSTGYDTEEKSAEGVLRVYNNHSSLPQILVAETRFVSSDGKLFRSLERISVPGRTQLGAGHIDVRVRAAEPGEDYNIDRTVKFSIPGLQGTPMFTSVYAENLNPITGGFIGRLPKITQEDVDGARSILISDILAEVKNDIANNSQNLVLIDTLIAEDMLQETISPGVGENYESFNYSIKIKAKALAYDASDLEDLINEFLLEQVPDRDLTGELLFSEKKIWNNPELSYDVISISEAGAIIFVETSGIAYPEIEKMAFKREVSGKSLEEIRMILSDNPRILTFSVNVRPSWIKNAPSIDKINLRIQINN